MAFDTATNILWVLTYSGSTYTLQGYDNPAGYAVDAPSVTYDYIGTYSGSGAEISSFAVHNGTVYLAMPELMEQVSLLIHNIYTADCPDSNVSAVITPLKDIEDLAGAAGISDNAVISDMSVVDGALYVLFREVSPYNENLFTNFSNSAHNRITKIYLLILVIRLIITAGAVLSN